MVEFLYTSEYTVPDDDALAYSDFDHGIDVTATGSQMLWYVLIITRRRRFWRIFVSSH
jgi:hypothetical protein